MKHSLLKSWLMLCLLFLIGGGNSVWAEEAVYKTALFGSSYNSQGVSSYSASWTATNDNFTVKLANWNNNNNGWSYIKAGHQKTAYVGTITTAAAIDKAITKIVVTIDAITVANVTSIKLYSGTSADACTTEVGTFDKSTGAKTVTITSPATNKFYKIAFDCIAKANGCVQVSKVEYYYDNASGGDTPPATAPVAPTFSPTAGSVEKGTQITFSSETAGCTFRYTTDGTDPTATTGTAGSTYTINSDVTLKVVAIKGGSASETVSSASYTVAKHSATFYVNGTPNTTQYAKGDAITVPSNPEDINGKKFIGWTVSEIASPTDTKPSFVTPASTMGTEDVTYYAVFADVSAGSETLLETVGFESAEGYTATTTYNSSSYTTGSTGSKWKINYGAFATNGAIVGSQSAQFRVYSSGGGYGQLMNTVAYSSDITKVEYSAKTPNTNGQVKVSYSTNGSSWTDITTQSLTTTTTEYSVNVPVSGVKYIKFTAAGTKPKSGNYSIYVDGVKITAGAVSTFSGYCTTVGAAKTLDHIGVTGAKTLYKVGDTFSTECMTVTAYYDEGSTDSEVITSGYTISKTTALTADDNTITITYTKGEVTKTADVSINVVALDHIAITTAPSTTTYTEGSNFDKTGMVVTATWGTTTPNVIEEHIEDYTVTDCDNLQMGTTSVTIDYKGKTTTQAITVTALPTWTVHFSINGTVDNANDKSCKQGQSITEFPEVTTATGVTFMGWAKAAIEETEIAPTSYAAATNASSYTPEADGETLFAVYKRTEEAEHEGLILSISSGNDKIYVGTKNSDYLYAKTNKTDAEILFLEEGTFKYYDKDGNKQTAISGTYTENDITEGTNAGTVTYSYASGSDTYYLGYNYNNGSTPRFKAYKNNLSTYNGYFTKEVGIKVIPTDYYCTTVTLPVLESIEITTAPSKTAYFEGDDFDKTGMVVTAHYNTKDKTVSTYTVSPETNLTAGTDKVTVSYTDGGVTKTADQTISVAAITLDAISVTTQPTKLIYKPGDSFDVAGMVVAATYNDTRKNKDNVAYKTGDVTDGYTISRATFTEKGEQDVTISYTDGTRGTQTTTVRVQVNAALQSIAVTTAPTKNTYTCDEHLDKTGMVVTATYEGGATTDVTSSATTDFDEAAFTTVGQQTVTVTYTELGVTKTTTFDVTVNDYPTYTVTFNVNGTPTEVTETAGKAGVTPVVITNIGDYTFAGWSTTNVTEETTDAPTLIALTDGKYFPTAENAKTLYAVYTKNKDVEKAGFILSTEKSSTRYYLGARTGTNKYFGATSTKSDAETLYLEDGHIFYTTTDRNNNIVKNYVTYSGSSSDLSFSTTKPQKASWTITTTDGITTILDGTRYLAYNNRFAAYLDNTEYPHNLLKEESSESLLVSTLHYTSSPVATTTPTASFAEATKTVVADQTVTQTVTTNSTGAVTYSSSDETIARVDPSTGEVTGLKYGTVTITANIAEVPGQFYSNSATYTVNVNRITTEIAFKDAEANTITTADVYADNEYTFTAQTNSDATIAYSLSATTYATIDSETGVITFKPATGTTWTSDKQVTAYAKVNQTDRYTAASSNSLAAKITISIKDNRLTQTIAFPEGSDKNFVKGDAVENFTIAATDAVTAVTYASNNTDVAEVNENTGEVTVHTTAGGTATVTATAAGSKVWNEELGIFNTYNQSTATYTINVDNMARPVISVAGGNYDAAQTVTISGDGRAYFYTLDGTDPTYDVKTMDSYGIEYANPILINRDCTLKVIAISEELDAVSAMAQATYTFNFPAVATTAWENDATIHMIGENYVLTAPEGAIISYKINEGEKVVTEDQVVNINFENYGKYNLTVDVVKNGLTTTTTVENLAVYGFADVPFEYDGNSSEMPLCFYGNTADYSNSPKIQFKNTGTTQLTLMMVSDGGAQLSYDYAFYGTWAEGNSFKVEMSIDGTKWETLKTYNTQLTSGEKQSDRISIPSLETESYRYIRWTYTKVSGNWALGNIKVNLAPEVMTTDGTAIITGTVINSNEVISKLQKGTTSLDLTEATVSDDVISAIATAVNTTNILTYVSSYSGETANVVVVNGDNRTCENLVLTDKVAVNIPEEITATNISYDRGSNLEAGKYATVYLPYAFPIGNFKVMKFDGVSGGVVNFEYVETTEPNVPYVIRPNESEDVSLSFNIENGNTIVTTTISDPVEGMSVNDKDTDRMLNRRKVAQGDEGATGFYGTYEELMLNGNDGYYGFASGKFKKANTTNGTKITPFRAYLFIYGTPNARLDSFGFNEMDDVTGVKDIFDAFEQNEPMYDLSGRKVTNPAPGQVIIIRGRKVMFN